MTITISLAALCASVAASDVTGKDVIVVIGAGPCHCTQTQTHRTTDPMNTISTIHYIHLVEIQIGHSQTNVTVCHFCCIAYHLSATWLCMGGHVGVF